jgi:hypothetical protein
MRPYLILLFPICFILFGSTCILDNIIMPPKLKGPVITKANFEAVKLPGIGDYTEALHVSWTPPPTDSNAISAFVLLKRAPGDTIFEQHANIPPDTLDFYEAVDRMNFPSEGYDSMFFRLYALDTLGRPGDTSEICTLYTVPQPALDTIANGCFKWRERGVFSAVMSYMKLWNDSLKIHWTSDKYDAFPPVEKDAEYSACIPDSLLAIRKIKWYYSIYIEASERYSILMGTLDVP